MGEAGHVQAVSQPRAQDLGLLFSPSVSESTVLHFAQV